jgi:hypothetical protein
MLPSEQASFNFICVVSSKTFKTPADEAPELALKSGQRFTIILR